MVHIDKGVRFTNYLIDIFVILVAWIILGMIFTTSHIGSTEFYGLMFLYYFFFESISGQTPGKMITKTTVVNKNGTRPNAFKILIRSFLRLIPIDGLSYLVGTELGFHDIASATKLIRKRK